MRYATLALAALAVLLAATPGLAQPIPLDVVWTQMVGASSVAFSPDGRLVASGGLLSRTGGHSTGRLDLFRATDGASVAHREAHGSLVLGAGSGVAFSPDGSRLASANGDLYCESECAPDRAGLFTWAVPDLAPLAVADLATPGLRLPRAVAFGSDGSALATGYSGGGPPGGELVVHDGATLALERTLQSDTYNTPSVAYSPDGLLLAAVGSSGQLKLWDAATGVFLRQVRHGVSHDGGVPVSFAFSPDGQRIVTSGAGDDARVRVWRTSDLAPLLDLNARVSGSGQGSGSLFNSSIAYAPNGAYLIGALVQRDMDGTVTSVIRFWDAATGAVVREYDAGVEGAVALAVSLAHAHRFVYASGQAIRMVETTLTLADGTTATEGAPTPAAYHLVPTGPNPSAAPALALTVREAQHVRAEAYDALGRRVAVLLDTDVAAGASVRFGLDGAELALGVYVVRVVGETFSVARTLTRVH